MVQYFSISPPGINCEKKRCGNEEGLDRYGNNVILKYWMGMPGTASSERAWRRSWSLERKGVDMCHPDMF